MADPAYVSSVDIHYNNVTVKCAVFVAGPPQILIRYDALDDKGKQHLAYLVAQKGALPYQNLNNLYACVLDNGQTYFDTYVKSIVSLPATPPKLAGPLDADLKYYNGNAWVSLAS